MLPIRSRVPSFEPPTDALEKSKDVRIGSAMSAEPFPLFGGRFPFDRMKKNRNSDSF
jgi:hypothetical protein